MTASIYENLQSARRRLNVHRSMGSGKADVTTISSIRSGPSLEGGVNSMGGG